MIAWLKRLFKILFAPLPKPEPKPERDYKAVSVYIFDPILDNGEGIIEACGFNDPEELADQYVQKMHILSGGLANYLIVETRWSNSIPVKVDGFGYKPEQLERVLAGIEPAHEPDEANYLSLLKDTGLLSDVMTGKIDEVWLFGPPHAGFFESRECGMFPRWVNAPGLVIPGVKRFIVMGFNYERGLGEMLEDFGHRCESLLSNRPGWNEWVKEYGTVHRLPQDTEDYKWQGMGIVNHHIWWLSRLQSEWWEFVR